MKLQKKGILTKWNNDKGFGFITPLGERESVFVHIKDFKNKQKRPTLNQNVNFTLSRSKGKPTAIHVELDTHSEIIRKKGILTTWYEDKGYGFITPVREKKELFVHRNAFQGKPFLHNKVSFTLSKDKSNRDCAINVVMFDEAKLEGSIEKTNRLFKLLSIIAITLFYFILFYLSEHREIESYTILYYLLISIFTYYVYAYDKRAAKEGNSRISENTLHLLSILGGWSGGLLAQNKLQHKSRKTSFKIIFFITILLNITLLYGLYYFKYL